MSENDKKPPIQWRFIISALIVAALLYFKPFTQSDEATDQTIPGTPTEQTQKATKSETPTYSQFIDDVSAGKVSDVYMYEGSVGGILIALKDGSQYKVFSPGDPKLTDQLLATDVKIHVKSIPKPEESSWLSTIFISFGPMILLIVIWIYFMRRMQGGGAGGGAGAMGKVSQTKATRFGPGEIEDRFTDVAGCDEAIGEVKEVLDFMRNPEKYKKLGADIPRGILLDGPPGTGKTLLARAIAGECGAVFYEEKGSSFVEMFVGVGAGRVRDLFDRAEKEGVPTFIFIDEIDALGGSRGGASGGNNGQEHEQTLTELLARMQGFRKSNIPIIIIGATNRPDKLDPALTRPGRFDRKVTLGLPDVEGRYRILLVHTRDKPLAKTVNLMDLARGYIGASGADLKNMANEAAIQAARRNGTVLTMADFEKAKDKIMMGEERKVNLMTEKEKILTAYHEAGHAIVGSLVPGHDPVYKVSIVPRGRALGITMYLPEKERVSATKADLEGMISSVYGGRIAEEIVGGKGGITTGASNDYQRATQLISGMIMQYGLYSDELGHLVFASEYGDHLGTGIRQMAYSDATAEQIDALKKHETHRIYESTKEILLAHRDKLEVMKDALMKWETIDKPQIDAVIAGKTLEDEDFPLPKYMTEIDKGTKEEAESNKEIPVVELTKPEGKQE
jgi:cell division protease FtsH